MIWGYLALGIIIIACVVSQFGINKNIICPNSNCGYKGPAKRVARGSAIVGLFLLCFFILPGILYFMFKGGYRYSCPQCGMQISSDN